MGAGQGAQQQARAVAVTTALTMMIPVIDEQVALGKRIRDFDLVIELMQDREINKPGRGRMAFQDTPRDRNLGLFNVDLINRLLEDPVKCQAAIVYTPPEFNYFLPFFTAECIARGYREGSKTGYREKLFLTLYFLKKGHDYRALEDTFSYSKSSCQKLIDRTLAVLVHVLTMYFRNLWPNRAERDLMKTFLPDHFRNLAIKPFFLVDSTTLKTVDSVYEDTRKIHWNNHKQYGPHCIPISDIFGNALGIFKTLSNGNGDDLHQYQATSVFNQRDGFEFDDDETAMADSAYSGKVKVNGPAEFLMKYTDAEITALVLINPAAAADARSWNNSFNIIKNPVEQITGGNKGKSALQGDRRKIGASSHCNFEKIELISEAAQLLAMSTMRLRNQFHQSNSAVLMHGLQGVDRFEQIRNALLYHDRLLSTRPGMYFGGSLAGNRTQAPPIYPHH